MRKNETIQRKYLLKIEELNLPKGKYASEVYNVGDEVEVLIKKFTPQEHRIALSVKDIQK